MCGHSETRWGVTENAVLGSIGQHKADTHTHIFCHVTRSVKSTLGMVSLQKRKKVILAKRRREEE